MRKLRKRMLAALLAAVMAVGLFPTFASQAQAAGSAPGSGGIQAEFFVSPTGSDENPGTYERPFATLTAARDAVRKINSSMTGDIYVFLAAGDYYIDETIRFDERDSGANGHRIIYRNLDGLGTANLIGGRKVESAWSVVGSVADPMDPDSDLPASAAGKVYKTNVGTDLGGDSINTKYVDDPGVFYTLYVNDRRATLVRTQNREQLGNFSSALTPYMYANGGSVNDLNYRNGQLSAAEITALQNAEARGDLNASIYAWDGGYWDWMTDTMPLSHIDAAQNKLVFKKVENHPEVYRPKYMMGHPFGGSGAARYFIQGNLGFLDVPGEYYYNAKTGDLYYYPENPSDLNNVVIPYVQEVIRVEGSSKDSKVSNITFDGLTVKDTDHTEWYAYGWNYDDGYCGLKFYPEEAQGSKLPSYCEQTERIEFQYGNITLVNTDSIHITNSHIYNSGMFGVELYLANTNALIENCMIEYTAHGGINLDGGYPAVGGDEEGNGYSNHNTVTNCVVHDIGELVGQASGFTIQSSGYNTVSHMEIYNSPRRGIFLTAGHWREYGKHYSDDLSQSGDLDYDMMKHLYTHHNTIEYVYLHDCQQDGGDDGAIFACYLFCPSWGQNNPTKGSRPNYISQVVVDSVGGNPTMLDIAPNGINLDMGCDGFVLENVKSVNPQHFNMEAETTHHHGGTITYKNTNIDFGTFMNQLEEFDDSKMEYDKIGITKNFPQEYLTGTVEPKAEYQDLYFSEDFENGISFDKWSAVGSPEITTEWMSEGGLEGRQALMINSDSANKPVLYRSFAEDLNKIVSVKMFDRAGYNMAPYASGVSINLNVTTYASVFGGEAEVAMGIDNGFGGGSDGEYVVKAGDQKYKTGIGRIYGWHELTFDYSSGTDVKLYFDGVLVKTLTAADGVSMSFDTVKLGSENGSGVTFFDELYIHGGKPAGDPGDVELPAIPKAADAQSEVLSVSRNSGRTLSLNSDGGYAVESRKTVLTPDFEVNGELTQSVDEDSGVLQFDCEDGFVFVGTDGIDGTGYTLDFDWKFGEWKDAEAEGSVAVSFGTEDGPRFDLYSTEDEAGGAWRHVTMQVQGTQLTVLVDGEVVFEEENDAFDGFGIGGVNAVFCIDNLTLTCVEEPDVPDVPDVSDEPDGADDLDNADDLDELDESDKLNESGELDESDEPDMSDEPGESDASNDVKLPRADLPDFEGTEVLSYDFGDAQTAIPGHVKGTITQAIVDDTDKGKVLQLDCEDGVLFVETDKKDWKDYRLEFDWKFGEWGNTNVANLGFEYDNITAYFRTQDNNGNANDPKNYQFIIRRNYKGTYGQDTYEDSRYKEMYQLGIHAPSDSALQTAAGADTIITDNAWHHIAVDAVGSQLTVWVDGMEVLNKEDSNFAYGGFGIGGMNSKFYIDNLTLTVAEPEPEEEIDQSKMFFDFEDGEGMNFTFTNNKVSQSVVEDNGNKVLKLDVEDGSALYNTNAEWSNYMVDFKWKFGGWGSHNILNYAYDNFMCLVMTTAENDKQLSNPNSYRVFYRRNISGEPYFEIGKRTSNGDPSLGTVPVPNGFDINEWHDVSIQTFGGSVGFAIDGEKVFSATDGQYNSGGIGFGGINYICYLDDIRITLDPKTVEYDEHLGLTNIEMNGVFNPNYFNYIVRVEDRSNPVTFTAPTVIAGSGVTMSCTLNGKALDLDNGPVDLALETGANTLVITEEGIVEKTYTVTILNPVKITSAEGIAPVTTALGEAPALPNSVSASFADGSTQSVEVVWKLYNPALLRQTEPFTVTGCLKGYDYEVTTTVTPSGVTGVSALPPITTKVGVAPAFAATVPAAGTTRNLPLTFAALDPSLYAQTGKILGVAGVDGYAHDVLQLVTVGSEDAVDKTALDEAIRRAEGITNNNYTSASWNAFLRALEQARAVFADESAGQAEVDSAAAALNEAIANLRQADPNPTPNPTPDPKPTPKPDPKPDPGTDPGAVDPDPGQSPDPKPSPELPLNDVNRGDWFYDAIEFVHENGLMTGTGNGQFEPNSPTTRAMVITILYRQHGSPDVASDKAAWWSDARAWAMLNSISDGTNMDDSVTREQLAALLYRYALLTGRDVSAREDLGAFSDASNVSSWATEVMQWAVGEGIIQGSNGSLNPQGIATRAEVATMLMRFLKK